MFNKSICIASLSLLAAGLAMGQEIGGATLNGTVNDPSGGRIAGAKITATQTATGLARTTESSSAGLFNFNALPVGDYDLVVEAKGFKQSKLANLAVSVGAV